MRKIITMVLYNRPGYTREVLEGLRRCAGIGEYLLLPRIEPGCDEVIEMARGIDFAETRVTINPERLGGGRNTYLAWEAGFAEGEFIVHMEDDTVPAPDCLRYMEHCAQAYRNDPRIFSVASYNRYPCPPEKRDAVATRRQYTCWLVGLWRDRWTWAKDNWSPEARRYASHLAQRVAEKNWREVYPLWSRSQNIGIENGIHAHTAKWHQVYHQTKHWAGDGSLPSPPAAYREVRDPMVTAVMITGMHPDRYRTARIAIECFKNQSHAHKQLVIINHGDQALDCHDDARIEEWMVKKQPRDTIGDLRNLGLQHAKGDLVMPWDDDDWHGPERMAVQVAAQRGDAAVLLRRQIRYNVLNRSGFCIEVANGLSNSILHPWLPQARYESLIRGEDSVFLQCFKEIIVADNDPLLHLRTYDGLNLWDAQHTMQRYADDACKDRLDVDESIRPKTQEIVAQYIPRWGIDARLRQSIVPRAEL